MIFESVFSMDLVMAGKISLKIKLIFPAVKD